MRIKSKLKCWKTPLTENIGGSSEMNVKKMDFEKMWFLLKGRMIEKEMNASSLDARMALRDIRTIMDSLEAKTVKGDQS